VDPASPPSPAPTRPPERRGKRRIEAGLKNSAFAALYCSREKGKEETRTLSDIIFILKQFLTNQS